MLRTFVSQALKLRGLLIDLADDNDHHFIRAVRATQSKPSGISYVSGTSGITNSSVDDSQI